MEYTLGGVQSETTNFDYCLQIYDAVGQSKFVLRNLRHYTVHPNLVGGRNIPPRSLRASFSSGAEAPCRVPSVPPSAACFCDCACS